MTIDGDELRVPHEALPEMARVHAVAVAERHSVADTLVVERGGENGETGTGETVSVSRPADPPAWAGDATIYEIFVRSFAGETVDTTFEAIERRVPYIESLGVDVVWLTPVQASPTREGYHSLILDSQTRPSGVRLYCRPTPRRRDSGWLRPRHHPQLAGPPGVPASPGRCPRVRRLFERIPVSQDVSDVTGRNGRTGLYSTGD